VSRFAPISWFLLAVFPAGAGCTRADLYPITREADVGATDAGATDAGATDAGATDAGATDAGATDAGATDAGATDAGATDAGATDAGESDGGGAPLACPGVVVPPGDSSQTVVVDGVTRSYLLHVPPFYDGRKEVPLVVDFHGVGGTGMSERTSSAYPAALDPEGVVMAFPDGVRGPAGTAWNVGPCCVAGVDDVAFARALVDQVRGIACIDPARVYAVGVLTGGGMAHYLGCHAADVFAAVAPAAFDLLAENASDCTPARPITVISFRGTADSRVPYEGGPSSLVPGMPLTFLGAQGTFEEWSAIDGCVGPASAPDADGCSGYAGCEDGVEVILCTKQGGREEPGDPSIAWPVLARHAL